MAIGVSIICDRCNTQIIVKERDAPKYEHRDVHMRWEHLCEKCAKEYEDMESRVNSFRQEQENKFY